MPLSQPAPHCLSPSPPLQSGRRDDEETARWIGTEGAKYVVEYQGRPADPKRAFRNLANEVLGKDAVGVVRHTLRHTSATWLMQGGVDMWQASGYLGMTKETLEKTYGHHHPDHQADVGDSFTSGRAGRGKKPIVAAIVAVKNEEDAETIGKTGRSGRI